MIDTSIPERALVIAAHPDDVDFGAAGTVATWTDAGADVTYCIVTDGDAGGSDESVARTTMADIRRREQAAAAKTLGVERLVFLGYPDGRVEATLALRRDLSRVIRDVRPTRVLSPSPERNYRRIYASHPDHLAVGEAALAAVYPDARNPFAHPELRDAGFEPWAVGELYLMAAPETDTYVDITDTIDRKVEALRCHVSQLPDPDGIDERLRTWAAANAEVAGLPPGRLAEAFLRIETG